MLFNSTGFLIFFPIVVLGYFWIPRRYKNLWLLGASYYFYASWNPAYLLLIIATTAVSWATGLLIDRDDRQNKKAYWRKWHLAAGGVVESWCFILF